MPRFFAPVVRGDARVPDRHVDRYEWLRTPRGTFYPGGEEMYWFTRTIQQEADLNTGFILRLVEHPDDWVVKSLIETVRKTMVRNPTGVVSEKARETIEWAIIKRLDRDEAAIGELALLWARDYDKYDEEADRGALFESVLKERVRTFIEQHESTEDIVYDVPLEWGPRVLTRFGSILPVNASLGKLAAGLLLQRSWSGTRSFEMILGTPGLTRLAVEYIVQHATQASEGNLTGMVEHILVCIAQDLPIPDDVGQIVVMLGRWWKSMRVNTPVATRVAVELYRQRTMSEEGEVLWEYLMTSDLDDQWLRLIADAVLESPRVRREHVVGLLSRIGNQGDRARLIGRLSRCLREGEREGEKDEAQMPRAGR